MQIGRSRIGEAGLSIVKELKENRCGSMYGAKGKSVGLEAEETDGVDPHSMREVIFLLRAMGKH